MFTGCGTALVTPFEPGGKLDEAALRRLVRRQIAAGIDFLVPCGTTGESPTLTREEHLRVIAITVEEAKQNRTPVLAGAGGYNTREVIELAHACQRAGADGILSVTPYYNKPTQEGLFQHYKTIAAEVAMPIVIYSVQGRTGVNVEPATLARLAQIRQHRRCQGSVRQYLAAGRRHPPRARRAFSCSRATTPLRYPVSSLSGGRGVISVASNLIPAEMTKLTHLALANDFPGARELQRQWLPLMEVNFVESNPMPVKAALAAMGLIHPVYRLPMLAPQPESIAKIEKVLEAVGLGRHAVA